MVERRTVNCWNNYEQVKAWQWEGLKRRFRGFLVTEPQNILWNCGYQPRWFLTPRTDLHHHEHKLNNISIHIIITRGAVFNIVEHFMRKRTHTFDKNLERKNTLHARYNRTTIITTNYRRKNNQTKIKCLSFMHPSSLCFISHVTKTDEEHSIYDSANKIILLYMLRNLENI